MPFFKSSVANETEHLSGGMMFDYIWFLLCQPLRNMSESLKSTRIFPSHNVTPASTTSNSKCPCVFEPALCKDHLMHRFDLSSTALGQEV
jgi:hypothetical protein